MISGGSGIRTHGGLRHDGFQDRYLQPLGHPSEPKDFTISSYHCEGDYDFVILIVKREATILTPTSFGV